MSSLSKKLSFPLGRGLGGDVPAAGTMTLDVLGLAPRAAYSLRKLRSDYSGPAIRVRRSSDNTELDIGFDGEDLDTASLLTFAGAGNAFVKTWYEQTGHGEDLAQATAANQPRIVSAGAVELFGTKPTIRLLKANSTSLNTVATMTINQPFVRSSVMAVLDAADTAACFYGTFVGATPNQLYMNVAGSMAMYGGAEFAFATGIADGTLATVTEVYNGASSEGRFNGAAANGNAGSTANLAGLALGCVGQTQDFFSNAKHSEVILLDFLPSDVTLAALEANQKAYWGTP